MTKLPVKTIMIEVAEGSHCRDGVRTFTSWKHATEYVWRVARGAPKDGSYHKTDVHIEWTNGHTYGFRMDMTYDHLRQQEPIANEVRLDLLFYSGRRCPPHLNQNAYPAMLEQFGISDELKMRLGRILDECEIPGI